MSTEEIKQKAKDIAIEAYLIYKTMEINIKRETIGFQIKELQEGALKKVGSLIANAITAALAGKSAVPEGKE
jgi:hypothetical protein